MPDARPRQSVDFDHRNPPKSVTDPLGLGASPVVPPAFQQYVYRAHPEGASLRPEERTAYLAQHPFGEMRLVRSEQELAEARAEGWHLTPQPWPTKKSATKAA